MKSLKRNFCRHHNITCRRTGYRTFHSRPTKASRDAFRTTPSNNYNSRPGPHCPGCHSMPWCSPIRDHIGIRILSHKLEIGEAENVHQPAMVSNIVDRYVSALANTKQPLLNRLRMSSTSTLLNHLKAPTILGGYLYCKVMSLEVRPQL